MIVGLGIDLVCLSEFAHRIASPAFVQAHFTASEIAYCERRVGGALPSFGARYAAKEATIKALGSYHTFRTPLIAVPDYREIEVTHDPNGCPQLAFHGAIGAIVGSQSLHTMVSLSHDGDYATAQVILLEPVGL